MRLGTCLLIGGHTPQGALHKLADFCSAPVAGFYSAVDRQKVRAEVSEQDAHGRTVARCYLPDGRDLSAEMVKLGLAIDWPKFSEGQYRSLETPDARKKLWLADARQKGRMQVWEKFEARQKSETEKK